MASKFKNISALEEIQELAHAFQKSRILFTALELDIFSKLNCENGKTFEVLSEELQVDARALERLLNVLVALKLLDKNSEGYLNNPKYRSLLVKGECDFIGDLLHISHLWDSWTDLTEIIRTGKPTEFKSINEKDESWIHDFIASTQWKSKLQAESIVNLINLKKVDKVLDLGCGSGQYAIEFLKQKPNIKPVVFDYPKVIENARNLAQSEGYADKIEFLSGDIMKDDIGSGYDLVFISNVIHEFSIWDNVKILQKVFDAMNRGGWVVINEIIINDSRTAPEYSAMFAVNMLVNTLAGDSYTETDIWIMLREAWFSNIKRKETEFETSLMFGQK